LHKPYQRAQVFNKIRCPKLAHQAAVLFPRQGQQLWNTRASMRNARFSFAFVRLAVARGGQIFL